LTELPPIEERVLGDVNGSLGDAVGKLYVDEYFPPEAQAQILELVDELVAAFRARIEANSWLSDSAKAEALEKLDNLIVKVGYPEQWHSYEAVEITDSYAGSILSAHNADYRRMLARVGQPVDKTEWVFPPQTVNAFYDSADNAITFPAAILQAPFFDYQADAATNYGGIGIVIGHELTHGFDLQGSQFDADGNLNSWWTDEDAAAFGERNDRVVAQYSAIELQPGLNVDGQRTVTEDVADMGGMQIAYDALELHLSQAGQADSIATPLASPGATPIASPVTEATPIASPVTFALDQLTPQQIFFISSATVWREEITPQYLETLVRSDEHAPSQVRAIAAMQNMDEFYEAFDVQPGDAMYLAPEDRIVIW
jgi:putative endopeptidase